jgi:hypothetical protein
MGYAEALLLPPNVWGFLEWTTGVIRINATVGELQRLGDLKERARLAYQETVTHEFFHCAQICAAGYPHHFAVSVVKELLPVLYPFLEGFSAYTDLGEASLRFAEAPPPVPRALVTVLEGLDAPGDDGITPREIVESAAYLVQKRTHRPGLDAAGFGRILPFAPAPEYQTAFLVAESILGDRAFELLPALSYFSLCYLRPQDVFIPLCRAASRLPGGGGHSLAHVAEELTRSYRCLGTSFRYTRDFTGGTFNPFYRSHARTLAAIGRWKRTDLPGLMSNPHEWMPEFRSRLRTPVILNPDDIATFRVRHGRAEPPAIRMKLKCILATYCFILMDGELGPHYLRSATAGDRTDPREG